MRIFFFFTPPACARAQNCTKYQLHSRSLVFVKIFKNLRAALRRRRFAFSPLSHVLSSLFPYFYHMACVYVATNIRIASGLVSLKFTRTYYPHRFYTALSLKEKHWRLLIPQNWSYRSSSPSCRWYRRSRYCWPFSWKWNNINRSAISFFFFLL